MASSLKPEILVWPAGAAISKGMAVKKGSDDNHVVKGAANTDNCVGICQNAPAALGDVAEVAVGGGAKALVGEAVVMGDMLVSHTDGTLVKANAAGDKLVAMALADGSTNDLVDVLVIHGDAAAAE
jgi:hypothetical protein